ncbi:uridine kinase [Mycoplasmoides gallisepticum str. R(low)]|uniref:Uridine kinase n=3 Tax=Mycoplasmoides gallisepticum TaxID=2096 RepID=Q7NB32_MYCGA|nr:uridine kinase [Mycoplasmoides gallisepticum]AAP56798.1 uridine kinase [Mycoplasmoides gallisepticum str. R(low)]ADC30654.1 uridine kinase [Mycoplasmoides gallisepticum str. R(high)]
MKNVQPMIIAIAGGSGSGKTTITQSIIAKIKSDTNLKVATVCLDNYYKPFSDLNLEARKKLNYDDPNSFDFDQVYYDLLALSNNQTIKMPIYDYKNYTRSDQFTEIDPSDVILYEGILSLYDSRILDLSKFKLFIDTPSDERLARRIERDCLERARDIKQVLNQWRSQVRVMHRKYVQKQKEGANLILPWYTLNHEGMSIIQNAIIKIAQGNEF